MAIETSIQKSFLREPGVQRMVAGYPLATALRIYQHEIIRTLEAGQAWVQEEPIVEVFFQGAVGIGIRPDFSTGSLSVVTRVLTSNGYREVVDPDKGFYYFNSKFQGAANTPENLASFAGAAAYQLEQHAQAIKYDRFRNRTSLIH